MYSQQVGTFSKCIHTTDSDIIMAATCSYIARLNSYSHSSLPCCEIIAFSYSTCCEVAFSHSTCCEVAFSHSTCCEIAFSHSTAFIYVHAVGIATLILIMTMSTDILRPVEY